MTFKFQQGSDGPRQYARLQISECGRKERDDAPVILVEEEGDNITLRVYADILSSEPTHEISLNGAKLKLKPKTEAL